MDTPLNASASTAGGLVSGSVFEVPPYQREYSWREDEVREFFQDIQRSLDGDSYFLGLIILTDEDGKKKIVDGQQRVVTLTLLASALYHEANKRGRSALADRLKADFLTSINYETDGSDARVVLTDDADNATLQKIISSGVVENYSASDDTVSAEIVKSYRLISRELAEDLKVDPFRRLGKWTEFITHKLYFAVFVHPTPSSAYQVFEVINTRGRDLTTADLLKNFVISQVPSARKAEIYDRWKAIADKFSTDGANNFVQYIRHVVTVSSGYVLPKDLFSFLASRSEQGNRTAPAPLALVETLEFRLPTYLQMVDPSLAGPVGEQALGVFRALNRLNVITVRPLMMAILDAEDPNEGLRQLLQLVVRRIVVGNLGTGNIERRFSEAARKVHETGNWGEALQDLSDLNPDRESFVDQLKKRSFNKGVMTFIRNSIVSKSITPDSYYYLHYIIPKNSKGNHGFSDGELSFWGNAIGNTFLSTKEKRASNSEDWGAFKQLMFPLAAPGEFVAELLPYLDWNVDAIRAWGAFLSEQAAEVWYA
ncbi:DUF262 domain-containing protein [Nitratireductor indicus]|uniref:DUF262 domain-containing protein n=1 Tax=Nitratireductor indicus TaxID=721133 RepID=UPI002874CD77|nr:DUF262 domain-containing protein [Nitratireductor indicus]MDS1136712.1 DUF262 domain-containing protein [Nitratireductor indicus]